MSLSFYVHIPYCVRRCGYCDFNTYTPGELHKGSDSVAGVSQGYVDALLGEIAQSQRELGEREISTIFFGGGTPTLLPADHLGQIISALRESFGLANNCEITTEANPDSVTTDSLSELREAGFNRISFGVQSVKSHVLKVLDRTHDATRVGEVVSAARTAGFDSVSVDLIYGTPGESISDFDESLNYALSLPIDHLSAYALIVEQGTKFGAAVRRGDVVMPDDDETAEKYQVLDQKMSSAGFNWYELSNWSKPGHESRHNQAYWVSADWWGLGAGAHSHINGTRWWNLKHPTSYIDAITSRQSPATGAETLTHEEKKIESLMLRIRMREGIKRAEFESNQQALLDSFLHRGLFDERQWQEGRVVLSLKGRLLADQVVRELVS
jgi:putative oxygen-independent coproporphyrinogen III oxidase